MENSLKEVKSLRFLFLLIFWLRFNDFEQFSQTVFDSQSIKIHFFCNCFVIVSSVLFTQFQKVNVSLLIPSSSLTFDFIFEIFNFFLIIRESSLHTDKLIAYRQRFFITSTLNSFSIYLFNCSINICLKIHQTRHCNLNHTF